MQTSDKVKINFDNLPRGLHRDTSGNPKDTGVIFEGGLSGGGTVYKVYCLRLWNIELARLAIPEYT